MPQAKKQLTSKSNDLGAKFAQAWRLYAEGRPAYEDACGKHAELYAAALKKSGAPQFIEGQFSKQSTLLFDRCLVESGLADNKNEELGEAVSVLTKRIWATVPRTLSDLANLANAAASIHYEAWEEEPADLDYEVQAIRLLVDGVLRVAGQRLVLEGLPIPQQVACAYQQAREALDGTKETEDLKPVKTDWPQIKAFDEMFTDVRVTSGIVHGVVLALESPALDLPDREPLANALQYVEEALNRVKERLHQLTGD